MFKTNLIIALFLTLGAIFFFMKKAEEKRLIAKMEKTRLVLQQEFTTSNKDNQLIDLQFTRSQQEHIQRLWKQFTTTKNANTDNWLQHKNFSDNILRDSLKALITKNGSLQLVSQYNGSSPLNHYQIQLKIGEVYLDSIRVRLPYNKLSLAQTLNVNESLSLENQYAIPLIKQIALHTESEIEVRLIGKNAYRNFILSQKEKDAFKATWQLHQLLTI